MTTETRMAHTKQEGWEARDVIIMGRAKGHRGQEGKRVLHMSTGKASRGGLRTTARCAVRTPDGCESWILFDDFSKTLAQSSARCTERAVRELHATAMAAIEAVLAEARTFYERKDAADALHARREAELAQEEQDAQVAHGLGF